MVGPPTIPTSLSAVPAEMEALEVDIALLPVSGTYVMTAREAVEAALAIQPKLSAM